MAVRSIVAKEHGGSVVGRHQHVDIAVVVEVAERQATRHAWLGKRRPRGGRAVDERAVALIEEQQRRLCMADAGASRPRGFVDVTVGHDEIERAVECHVRKAAAEPEPVARGRANTRAHGHVLEQARGARPVEPDHLLIEVRDGHAHAAGVVEVARVDAHAGARTPLGAERDARRNAHLAKPAVPQVPVELVRLRVVGDDEIGPPVALIVDERDTERLRARVEDAARRGHVLERAVAAIAEQPAGVAAVRLGRAVGLRLPVGAAEDVVFDRPAHVVADEQIEMTVVVDVDPDRRRAEPLPSAEPARARRVDERALARVPKQPVLPHTRDEQIGEAVVVEIADGHAHAVHLDVETRARGDVGERAVAVVAEQLGCRSHPVMSGPVHAVDQQDVLPPVAVVVEERAPGAHRLGQQLAAVRAAVVREAKATRGGDVHEPQSRVGLRRQPREHVARRPRAGGRRACDAQHIAPVQCHSGPARPLRSAYTTRSAVLCTPSRLMMLARCTLTVFTLRPSRSAIARFDSP